ncbi:MAG: hypothetical protein ABW046_20730 [Actinoplanes sp.]
MARKEDHDDRTRQIQQQKGVSRAKASQEAWKQMVSESEKKWKDKA